VLAGISKDSFPQGFYQPIIGGVFQAFEATVQKSHQNTVVKLGGTVKFFETKEFNTNDILDNTEIVVGWKMLGQSIARSENRVYYNPDNSVSIQFETPVVEEIAVTEQIAA
jgi:hypothetical protein